MSSLLRLCCWASFVRSRTDTFGTLPTAHPHCCLRLLICRVAISLDSHSVLGVVIPQTP